MQQVFLIHTRAQSMTKVQTQTPHDVSARRWWRRDFSMWRLLLYTEGQPHTAHVIRSRCWWRQDVIQCDVCLRVCSVKVYLNQFNFTSSWRKRTLYSYEWYNLSHILADVWGGDGTLVDVHVGSDVWMASSGEVSGIKMGGYRKNYDMSCVDMSYVAAGSVRY